jgi:mannose-6-phosphate isomerase-like protein (cupin superfamily)
MLMILHFQNLNKMKNRRSFLQTTSAGILGSMLVSLPNFSLANNAGKKGIVKNEEEGEVYFVRETTFITIKVSKTDGIESVSICTEEIHPGDGIPVHKHLYNDEQFFFHKGRGSFMLDNSEYPVGEGSTAFVPRGTWHGLKNTGSEPLIFTFGFSPAGFEDYFRQVGTLKGTAFKAKPGDEKKILAKKYGMEFR